MFTYLKLKNFKSLKDVTLNLKETQKKTKKFIAIYFALSKNIRG